jgi:hypothetical protein
MDMPGPGQPLSVYLTAARRPGVRAAGSGPPTEHRKRARDGTDCLPATGPAARQRQALASSGSASAIGNVPECWNQPSPGAEHDSGRARRYRFGSAEANARSSIAITSGHRYSVSAIFTRRQSGVAR